MSHKVNYKDSLPQIKNFAYRVLRRAHAAGGKSIQIEDIISECNIAWCIAEKSFDPSMNVKFSTFLYRGMIMHINRWIQKEIDNSFHLSLDVEVGEDGEGSLHEIISSNEESVEDVLVKESSKKKILEKFNPTIRKILELLDNPPPEIMQEYHRIVERAEYAKGRGIPTICPSSVSAGLIMDAMGIYNADRSKIYKVLKKFAKERANG